MPNKPTRKKAPSFHLEKGETLMIRKVRCNKGACKKCPHASYAYATSGYAMKKKHRYLGTCDEAGRPRFRYSDIIK